MDELDLMLYVALNVSCVLISFVVAILVVSSCVKVISNLKP